MKFAHALWFAAVAALAVSSADAGIVYSGVLNAQMPSGNAADNSDELFVDMEGGTAAVDAIIGSDFSFDQTFGDTIEFHPNIGGGRGFGTFLAGSNGLRVTNFAPGDVIDASMITFTTDQNIELSSTFFATAFDEGEGGIIGVAFPIGADTHFGWIRVADINSLATSGSVGTVVDFAYNDVPDAGIAAGAIPEPASLGLLSLAGLGLLRRRSA